MPGTVQEATISSTADCPPADILQQIPGCPLCDSKSAQPLPTPTQLIGEQVFGPHRDKFKLNRCSSCGFVYLNPRPSQDLLGQFYNSNNYSCHSRAVSSHIVRARWTLSVLERHRQPSNSRLLDFGCGGGDFLLAACEAGWQQPCGYDIGARALDSSKSREVRVTGSIEEMKSWGPFDVITMNHVFEHVDEQASVLQLLRSMLSPEGVLCVEVPNAASLRARIASPGRVRKFQLDERYRAFPIHLSYFTPISLPKCLERQGFTINAVLTSGIGLDELKIAHDPIETAEGGPASASKPKRQSALKGLIKRLIFSLKLGENVIVVASPRQ